jgi:hypothetical protein
MNMADDATGKILSMLSGEETTAVAMTLQSCWIKKYGIPRGFTATVKTPVCHKPRASD